MKSESGSALQKASFVLLVLIAAALAYLIVRDRIRTERARAEEEQSAAASALSPAPVPARPTSPSEMRTSYAPLRPRLETNPARTSLSAIVPPGRVAGSNPSVISNDAGALALVDHGRSAGLPVPAATTSRGGDLVKGATIKGRVILRGNPPAETPITLDAFCARLNPAPITTRHYIVGEGGGLANVFVYIKSRMPADKTSAANMPLLDNINCQFEPYVLGVRAGQPFQIRNSDPVLHNIHALPKVAGNREFNLGFPVAGMTQQKVFDKAEVLVQIKCDVHPWMFAYVGVVDHPWFAVTDATGNFAFPGGLEHGTYTIAAVHRKAGESVKRISIDGNEAITLNFTLDVPEDLARTSLP